MSCTNGCNDCKCEPIEIKDKTTTVRDFSDKLRVLNEFGCLISITPCSQLGKIVAKYSFYLWCYLKDILRLLENMLDRMDHFLTKEEAERIYQKKLKAGKDIVIDGDVISANVDLSDYVPRSDYLKAKSALDKIIHNLESSGAWSGGIDGGFVSNRNIATGNINIFGGGTDSNSFIRTNNGQTENDLAGGVD